MRKGALALLISGGTENWAPLRWRERFLRVCSDRKVVLIPDDAIDLALVTYAAVWKPKSGALSDFPNLEVIFNLGAGVDAVVADLTLPPVPLVRVAVGDLTQRMTEYVVMHVLMHHRRQSYYAESQRNKAWAPNSQTGGLATATADNPYLERYEFLIGKGFQTRHSLGVTLDYKLTQQDVVVVRRAFAPQEYLSGATDLGSGIPANAELNVKLFIDASATMQAGYQVYLFYP